MATKRTCPDSHDLTEGREKLKTSRRGRGRSTMDLFSPRRIVGRNDMVVDLNLGKVVIPKEEATGVIKQEKISEELKNATDSTTAVEDEEMENIQVKLVGEEVDISDNFEADEATTLLTCSCACWNKIESLEAIVEEQGRQIQNINNVVMGLLGKQVASEQVQRHPGKESVVVSVFGEIEPTQAGEIESAKGGVKGVNPVTESLVLRSQVHQRQPEIPIADIPVISSDQSKNLGLPSSASAKKGSSRRLPPGPSHPNGNSNKPTRDGVSTKLKPKRLTGTSGEKHTCPHCSKEGRQRMFSRHENLRRHVQEKHTAQKKLHKCDTCSKTFSRKGFLGQHIKMVHEGVRYQCSHCTGSYANRHHLVEHEKIHARGIPLIRCKLCGLDLISVESLNSHLAKCVGAGKKRPKKSAEASPKREKVCANRSMRDCPECGKGFDCDASLRYHLHKEHGILQTGGESRLSDVVKGRLCQD